MMTNRITCRDIMIDDLNDLMQGEKAACMYVDPPWGAGNLKYWRTMNGQEGFAIDWTAFLKRLRFLYKKHVNSVAFIETGLRFEKDVTNVFGKADDVYVIKYKGGSKIYENLICIYGTTSEDITGLMGREIVEKCLFNYRFKSVFDPCVGLGGTVKVAKKYEMSIFCNELNIDRALRTAKILGVDIIGEGEGQR